MKKLIEAFFMLTFSSGITTLALAGSLENLERERSLAVTAMLDSNTSVETKWNKLTLSRARLADLEVIVINDKSLKNNHSYKVKRALSNYEMTFLAHAAAEHEKSISAHWFESIGLNTDQILASRLAK